MRINGKSRLDTLLAKRELVESRELAKALIMSSRVYVNGQKAIKPGAQVSDDAEVEITDLPPYVSRGGFKLESALDIFGVSVEDRICLDCGASTGGFTDCLLQNGAKLVYAVDVGYGQLAWSLRNDPRVIVMERTNIRTLTPDMFESRSELAVVDVSFISLALILPVVKKLLTNDGQALCLIKPQFEAGREKVGKKGVVRDPKTHKDVLQAFLDNASKAGFTTEGLTYSPIKGPQGNIEFFGALSQTGSDEAIDIVGIVEAAHKELNSASSGQLSLNIQEA